MRRTIELEDPAVVRDLLGVGDCYLRQIRDALNVNIVVRKDMIHVEGSAQAVERGAQAFVEMLRMVQNGTHLERSHVNRILETINGNAGPRKPNGAGNANDHHANGEMNRRKAGVDANGKDALSGRVRPLTDGQAKYLDAIRNHDVVFAIGPAGSGKTYLAVAMAIENLLKNTVNRLILVRPAVEAGEHLGFLPGDLREKVNPYLRPLYDALDDLMTAQQRSRFMERGVIEVAPLAFMRGRTLSSAVVILDEAQNTTPKQMKMFLTRLGRDSRAVITGDVTQVDLPESKQSGLAHAWEVLQGIKGVAFVHLKRDDIVRHPLVQRIVDAYDDSTDNGVNGQDEQAS